MTSDLFKEIMVKKFACPVFQRILCGDTGQQFLRLMKTLMSTGDHEVFSQPSICSST